MDDYAPATYDFSLQNLHSRSTHLPLELYDLSLSAPALQDEIDKLTRQIENLPSTTRQMISWLNQAPQLPSQQAIADIQEISNQCHQAFDRIGEISANLREGGFDDDGSMRDRLLSNSVHRKELLYLTALLEAMSLTMNVMIHTFEAARVSADPR